MVTFRKEVICFICIFIFIFLFKFQEENLGICWRYEATIMNDVISYDRDGKEIFRNDTIVHGAVRKNPSYLVIGIPTVYRQYKNKTAFYLSDTLNALITPLTTLQRKELQIIITLADREPWKRSYIMDRLMKDFSSELHNGLINIISIPDRFYLQLIDLTRTFNDSPERMYWRSKQTLDYAFIFNYAHKLCKYYMQIEDDVLADVNYYNIIKKRLADLDKDRKARVVEPFVQKKSDRLERDLEFSPLGFIGRVFEASYLPYMSSYLRLFYDQMPVDWLYVWILEYSHAKRVAYEDLFQHIGKQSSSSGT